MNERAGSSRTNSRPPSGSSLIWQPSTTSPCSHVHHAVAHPPATERSHVDPRIRCTRTAAPVAGRAGPSAAGASLERPAPSGHSELDQPGGELGQLGGRGPVLAQRSAVGVGSPRPPRTAGPVDGRVRSPWTASIHDRRPWSGGRGPSVLTPPDQLLQHEGLGPARRVEEHGLLDVAPAHADDQIGLLQHGLRSGPGSDGPGGRSRRGPSPRAPRRAPPGWQPAGGPDAGRGHLDRVGEALRSARRTGRRPSGNGRCWRCRRRGSERAECTGARCRPVTGPTPTGPTPTGPDIAVPAPRGAYARHRAGGCRAGATRPPPTHPDLTEPTDRQE